jgi:hypothetical protein
MNRIISEKKCGPMTLVLLDCFTRFGGNQYPVKLDVYEGMPHVFQFYLYDTPESKIALCKMNDFLKEYLK